jgi:hypothetical protein
MYTKKITYSREFLSGNLAGVIVRNQVIHTTADAAHTRCLELARWNSLNPGKDLSGNLYWNYNIGCEDIAPCVLSPACNCDACVKYYAAEVA